MKNNNHIDVYQMVTDRIIEQLEKGVVPWHQEWHGTIDGAFNRITKRRYSLLNQMLLEHDGEYASLKQWNKLGGRVKPGEHGELVVFWKIERYASTTTGINDEGQEETLTTYKTIPYLKYYKVFHISQVEGVKPLEITKPVDNNPIEKAEEVIENYVTKDHLKLRRDQPSNRAYYSPGADLVVVPMLSQFENEGGYYSTLFHELTHSTKHKSRLNRSNDCLAFFGNEEYSKEELVAEIGSANMMRILGIDTEGTFNNSASYIDNWLQVLKNDKKFIVSASSQASKATDYILKFTDGEETEDDGI